MKVALVMFDFLFLRQEFTFEGIADSLGTTQVLHRVALAKESLIRLDHPLRVFDLHEFWCCQIKVRTRFLNQNINVTTW